MSRCRELRHSVLDGAVVPVPWLDACRRHEICPPDSAARSRFLPDLACTTVRTAPLGPAAWRSTTTYAFHACGIMRQRPAIMIAVARRDLRSGGIDGGWQPGQRSGSWPLQRIAGSAGHVGQAGEIPAPASDRTYNSAAVFVIGDACARSAATWPRDVLVAEPDGRLSQEHPGGAWISRLSVRRRSWMLSASLSMTCYLPRLEDLALAGADPRLCPAAPVEARRSWRHHSASPRRSSCSN